MNPKRSHDIGHCACQIVERLEIEPHRPSASSPPAEASPQAQPDIAALTRRLVAGDDQAYRMFYELYFDRLWRYLLVVTAGDEHVAREALQGTLTRVVRHIRVFSDEAVFWSWLTVLARSARADDRRKRRRYLAFLDRFTREAPAAPEPASTARDDARLDEVLREAMAELPADERELLEAKYSAEQPVREIATQLQTTEKAVESRLGRIRRKLKDAVLAQLHHEPRA